MASSIRILHVEDDQQFADLTEAFLTRSDQRFTVEHTPNAAEALDFLTEESVDCIVSDYDMPGMDGIEFLEAVRQDCARLPFILFTGKGSETVASTAISEGVTDYLQKASGTDHFELLANRIQNAVDRRQAETEVKRWAKAVESANEGIAIIDHDGYYVKMNDAYADLANTTPDDLIGEHWNTTVPEAEVNRLQHNVFPTLDTDSWSGEAVGKRIDGSTYPKILSLAALDDGGHVCIIRDITEQREREAEIRRKAAKLDILFENSPDLIDIHDAGGQIIDINRRLCDALGYTKDELLGKYVWEIDQTIEPAEARTMWADMQDGEMRELQGSYQRQDGTTFPVNVHVALGDFNGKQRYFVIAREAGEKPSNEDNTGNR